MINLSQYLFFKLLLLSSSCYACRINLLQCLHYLSQIPQPAIQFHTPRGNNRREYLTVLWGIKNVGLKSTHEFTRGVLICMHSGGFRGVSWFPWKPQPLLKLLFIPEFWILSDRAVKSRLSNRTVTLTTQIRLVLLKLIIQLCEKERLLRGRIQGQWPLFSFLIFKLLAEIKIQLISRMETLFQKS